MNNPRKEPVREAVLYEHLDDSAVFETGCPTRKSTLHDEKQTVFLSLKEGVSRIEFKRMPDNQTAGQKIVALSYDFDGNCIDYNPIRNYDPAAFENLMNGAGFKKVQKGYRI